MMTKKEQLLQSLQKHTFIMIRPSAVEGIGVFALTDIKKGQRKIFSEDKSEWLRISRDEAASLPLHSRKLIETYCLYDEHDYFVPEYGFKMIDPVIFLNHADHPNIKSLNEGEDFEALRDIAEGEELFIDYGEIVDDIDGS